jgi:hypothetical protein
LEEQDLRIKELETELHVKQDEVLEKSLELHRLNITKPSTSKLPVPNAAFIILEKSSEIVKMKKPRVSGESTKNTSRKISGQMSIKGYVKEGKKDIKHIGPSKKSPASKPIVSKISPKKIEMMFDEDETIIDEAFEIYRNKHSLNSKSKVPKKESVEEDSISPIFPRSQTIISPHEKSAKQLLFGTQASSDEDDQAKTISPKKAVESKKRISDTVHKTKVKKSKEIDFSFLQRAKGSSRYIILLDCPRSLKSYCFFGRND